MSGLFDCCGLKQNAQAYSVILHHIYWIVLNRNQLNFAVEKRIYWIGIDPHQSSSYVSITLMPFLYLLLHFKLFF